MIDRPNLFSIATKELSQDAFIAWLMQWGDVKYKEADEGLFLIGQAFIRFLIKQQLNIGDYEVKKVGVWRQYSNIDIWAEVNDEICIIIEDKTNTAEHDNQLDRYAKLVKEYYADKGNWKFAFIYLKTGLESLYTRDVVRTNGWGYCSRRDFLSFLLEGKTSNDIYNEFVTALKDKDEEARSLIWNSWTATEGLYCYLQEAMNEDGDWGYVSNPSGGFLGYWFHWREFKSINDAKYYLQIENNMFDTSRLVIKLAGNWCGTTEYLYDRLDYLQNVSSKYGLSISKPSRYKVGEYTTLAVIDDALKLENDKVNLEQLLSVIKAAEAIVDDIAENS